MGIFIGRRLRRHLVGVGEKEGADVFDYLRLEPKEDVGAFYVVTNLAGVVKKSGSIGLGKVVGNGGFGD